MISFNIDTNIIINLQLSHVTRDQLLFVIVVIYILLDLPNMEEE